MSPDILIFLSNRITGFGLCVFSQAPVFGLVWFGFLTQGQ